MSSSDSQRTIRRDGWTPERQLRFLRVLVRTRSVTQAARSAGMSRESAYRLRNRRGNALFAAAWDKALRPARSPAASRSEGHKVGAGCRLDRRLLIAKFGANPRKVTKLAKLASPRFDPLFFDSP